MPRGTFAIQHFAHPMMTTGPLMAIDTRSEDLNHCDQEPIHLPGGIQSFGCLIATSTDWQITQVSSNAGSMLGLTAAQLVGSAFAEHFSSACIHHLRGHMHLLSATGPSARVFDYALFGDDRHFDVSMHLSGSSFVFEFEPTPAGSSLNDLVLVQQMAARLRAQTDLSKMCRNAARAIKSITGFHRVMVYRFAQDQSGSVIAEAVEPDMEPFLDLHYPATDIPKQARELYLRNLLRLVPDADGEVFPLWPPHGADGQPLNLSLAVTRAVSPVHLEYLRNMGVQATLTASIVRQGVLWGMVVCHHRSPRHVPYALRTAIELYVQLLSHAMAELESRADMQALSLARQVQNRVVAQMASGVDLFEHFSGLAQTLAEAIPFDGIVLFSEGRYAAQGLVPTQEEFAGLARFLNTTPPSAVFCSDRLTLHYPMAAGFVDRAAGVMALPISRQQRDFVALFRREQKQTVTWGGNPDKPMQADASGVRLSPRKSFAAWQETVHHRSVPWTPLELQTAESLRIALIEVVLKLTDQAHQITLRAQERQELLVAELNHRVRNILALIRGLIAKGRSDTNSNTVADFTNVLHGRVQALARAHDQLTQVNWEAASFAQLVAVEAEAYHHGGAPQVQVDGPDVLLEPTAFSTLAMVVHELISNSAKHGALTVPTGRVHVALTPGQGGGLCIAWRERGGPAVQPPTRQGFGTTIIQRSIPFELNGRAEHRYPATGAEADFFIPAGHFKAAQPMQAGPVLAPAPTMLAHLPRLDELIDGAVLLVEDNLIIAMDSQDMLEALGAQPVWQAASVAEALRILDKQTVVLAVLDVNLGKETSAGVASRLVQLGVPFVFATGYGSLAELQKQYPQAPFVTKPFDVQALSRAIASLKAAVTSAPLTQPAGRPG
jgi:light-regulated signal transduction histidine kinase (bacteriophytochrome)/ActR/RegA family two-component response regulator